MAVSYNPFSGADLPLTLAAFNTRFQSVEDYFLALVGSGAATQTTLEAIAGEGLGNRAPAYINLSDNKIYQMDSDAAGPKAGTIRGFVDGTTTIGNTATLVIAGLMDGFSALSGIAPVYVGTVAGTITQTKPSPSSGGSQVMIAEMGISIASDTLIVRPRPIQYQKRDDLALNATLSVQHHSDDRGYLRQIWAYITESETGAALASYASSNQDSGPSLQGNVPLTYGADQTSGGTATGSTTFAGTAASNAFDGNTGTRWVTNSVTTGWIRYQFAASKVIRKVRILPEPSFTARAPKDFTIEGSNDGSAWTVVATYTGETTWTTSVYNDYTFPNATTYTYWRINCSANNGDSTFFSVNEIEMMEGATYEAYEKLSQTFNLGSTSTVAGLELYLKKVGSPTGTITVRIETVSAGSPTGTLAHANATTTLAESSLTTSYAQVPISFSSFSLASGDYAIVLSTSRSISDLNYVLWGADGSSPGYASGEMKTYAPSSWSAASKDAIFSVIAVGTTHPENINVDWWGSTLADMVNRYGDGAGAETTTKTTFKCKRSAGFDDVTIVVELA
jgi:hypothetical protein